MPLARQTVPVLLKGLDQLAPRQTGLMSGIDSITNMVAQAGDQNGYEFVPRPGTTAIANPGSIFANAGTRLATLNGQLYMFSDTSIWRRANDGWHLASIDGRSTKFAVSSQRTTPIYVEGIAATSCDIAYVNGYVVTATTCPPPPAVSGTNFLDITVSDSASAALDGPGGSAGNSSFNDGGGDNQQVRIAVVGTVAIIFWAVANTSTIKCVKFDTATAQFGAVATVTTTASTAGAFNPIFDIQAIVGSGLIVVMWNDSATSQLTATLLNPSTMTVSGTTAYAAKGTNFVTKCFITNSFTANFLTIAYISSATGLHYDTISSSTLAVNTSTTLDATATAGASITGYATSQTTGVVYFTVKGTLPYDDVIKTATTTFPTAFGFMVGRAIASRASDLSSSNGTQPAFLTKYRGVGQASYFLVSAGTSPGFNPYDMGRSMPDIAAADPGNTLVGLLSLPNLAIGATSSTYLTAGLKSTAIQSGAGGLTSNTGAAAISFVLGDVTVGSPVELNSSLHIPGAMPLLYDGVSVTEEGFPIAPEQSDAYVYAGGGALTASSTYTYRYLFEWTDNAGNLHRSAPNLVAQQAVLGAAQTKVTHSIPTVINSRKRMIALGVYRTPANGDGSVYYRAGAVTFAPGAATRASFVDTVSDAVLVSGVPLYTDDNILENLSPPSCTSMAVHRGRLLAGGVDGDPTAIWFSKDVSAGFGIAFNDALVSRLSSTNETVTALGSMDAFAAAFTNATSWTSSDDYPDDTGSGGVLKFIQASSVNGCQSPRLLARGDDGLSCWQNKTTFTGGPGGGPWRFSRGSTWEWIGQPIQLDASALAPKMFLAVPSLNQMRVLGSTATALVHEAVFGTWATWTYLQGAPTIVDAILWQGNVAYLCSDASLIVENTSLYSDSATAIAHAITMSPFNFAGVAGYQRIYVGQLTGRVLGTAGLSESLVLRIVQTIDGVAMAAKTRTLTPDSNALFAGVEFDPGANGKCSAYQLTISNAAGAPNDSRCAWTLAGVTMDVGTKANVNRLPPANRAT